LFIVALSPLAFVVSSLYSNRSRVAALYFAERESRFEERIVIHTDVCTRVNFGLSTYVVENAFPGTDRLWGAMQVRDDPKRAGIYYVATFRGDVLRVERLEDGFKVCTVLSLASAKIGWMYSIALHPQFGSDKLNTNRVFVFYRSHDEAKRKFYRVSAFPITDKHRAEAMDEAVLIEQELGHYEHLGAPIAYWKETCQFDFHID